jgi:peptidoglycan/xylan/chitin deacetylase (PgdA/CDA1 family)
MDDMADQGFHKVQLATMNYFISKNMPFTASIIVSKIANSSNLQVFHKIEEGISKQLFEIAIHGYRHVNHSLLTKEEQVDDFREAKGKLEYLFGKRADIFIPPFNEFNLHTIEAMSDLNISLFSTSPDKEQGTTNPYKSQTLVVTNNSKLEVSRISDQKPLVYHAPFSVSFLRLARNGLFGDDLVREALRLIDDSIAKHGFAQVRLHPSDFAQVNATTTTGKFVNEVDNIESEEVNATTTTGKFVNEVDNIKFQHLTKTIDSLVDRNIKIASFDEIYPHSTTPSL